MSKHTPGPWTQDKYGNVKTPSGGMLVTDGVALGCYSTEETRANARLIAAAPELLEALIDLKREIILSDVDMKYIESHFAPWIEKARAAIAKAEGNT